MKVSSRIVVTGGKGAAMRWWPAWLHSVFPLVNRLMEAQEAGQGCGRGKRRGWPCSPYRDLNYRQFLLILQLIFTQEGQIFTVISIPYRNCR